MLRNLLRSIVALSLVAAPLSAQGIKDVTVLGGYWNGSSFAANGLNWNTYNGGNWAVGITLQGSLANPLLNGAGNVGTSSPNLADGSYYLFMQGQNQFHGYNYPYFNSFLISLSDGAVNRDMVYTFSTTDQFDAPGYTAVSGTGFTADGVSTSGIDRVGMGQYYAPADGSDFAIAINTTTTPEPASLVLLGTGLVGIVMVRRRKRLDA